MGCMYIVMNHSNETIRFAGQELEKYLQKMGNTMDSRGSGIAVGLYSDFADWPGDSEAGNGFPEGRSRLYV